MEELDEWFSNGDKNTVGLFLDDEHSAPKEFVALTQDGESFFFLHLHAPFEVANPSPSLNFLLRANGIACRSVQLRLDQLTRLMEEHAGEDVAYDDEPMTSNTTSAFAREKQMQQTLSGFDVAVLRKPAVDRILNDLVSLRDKKHDGWKASPSGRNLALWNVELFDFDAGSKLLADMREVERRTGSGSIHMQMTFPPEYPFKPPFLRVVRPRFAFRTGRVTIGGSICTELLTDEGWNPTYDVESLLVSIRAQITDPEASARVALEEIGKEYTEQEAKEAFRRVAEYHRTTGW